MNREMSCSRLLIVFAFLICLLFPAQLLAEEARLEILTSTFPVHQITRNIIQGLGDINIQLMLPPQLGCPHDYALTPQDMRKLASADILIINGLGLEEFIGAPLDKANSSLMIIDSSAGIEGVIEFAADESHKPDNHHSSANNCSHTDAENHHYTHNADNEVSGCDANTKINPHLFVSPSLRALLAENIARKLSRIIPDYAEIFIQNAIAYTTTMNQLAEEFSALGQRLANNNIVQPHGVFDYLARDIGLEISAVIQPHGQDPSAAEMIHIVRIIKEKNVGAILIEPQYSDRAGKTLARETGVPIAVLDPVASGPEDAPLDYFETIMRQNMKTLESTLGTN